MLRRWGVLLGLLTLVAGMAVATTGSASAGTMGFRPGGPIQLVGSASAVPNARGGIRHQAESTNWSGYAATTGTYTSVSASWTEPTGTCSGSAKYSSFWVGLDGYSSGSVEQTGSEVDCSGSTPKYYSWYEMYPAYPVNFSNTVRPGDHFTGSVTHTSGSSYTLKLSDTTQGWSHTVTKSLSGAANSSAEVIAEAPSSSSGVLPLAHFSPVTFTSAAVNGSAIGNFSPTQITMVDNSGRAEDSVSSLSGGNSFKVTWLRSN